MRAIHSRKAELITGPAALSSRDYITEVNLVLGAAFRSCEQDLTDGGFSTRRTCVTMAVRYDGCYQLLGLTAECSPAFSYAIPAKECPYLNNGNGMNALDQYSEEMSHKAINKGLSADSRTARMSMPSILSLYRRDEPEALPDECTEVGLRDDYNTGLHIGSVFIILAASAIGVFMPVIASKVAFLRISDRVLTLGKQFGTGVILSTAFIHMMPTAMYNLSSPCLGTTFSENYTAFGGLFILASSLFMHWIEFVAVEHNERRMREAAASQGIDNIDIDLGGLGATGVAAAPCPGHSVTVLEEVPCHDSCSSISSCGFDHASHNHENNSSLRAVKSSELVESSPTSSSSTVAQPTKEFQHVSSNHIHNKDLESNTVIHKTRSHHHHTHEVGHSHAHGLSLLDESQRKISTYILEAGIAAHSVIIGVSLGVSTSSEFVGLLIALVFHQFFEGFALGARISALAFDTSYTHYVLALIFSLTTPIGVAIGIGISNTYSANSKSSLLVEGIFDSVSTGIMLYMGYVNLLAIEFNLNGELRKESKKVKSMCFIALWLGAAVMAVIGRFA
ncbi:high-affinity Zn(2+) transporter zrt1 [Entomortierella beljakovae]|nr:high-affinity Zn(2+) transporter zrt1 [Entomortierella beljakovae]